MKLKFSFLSILKDHVTAIRLFVLATIFYVAGVNTNSGWLCILACLIAGLLIFSCVCVYLFSKLQLFLYMRDLEGYEGQEISADIEIHCQHAAPWCCASIEFIFPEGITCEDRLFFKELNQEKSSSQIKLKLQKRGIYNFYCAKLKLSDPFGLICKYYTMCYSRQIIVKPSLSTARQNYASLMKPGETASIERGRSTDLRNIRDYINGEDTRFIHWASSAKQGTLMIREFTKESLANLFIVIENDALYGSDPGALEKLLSCASYLIKQNASKKGKTIIACALPSLENGFIFDGILQLPQNPQIQPIIETLFENNKKKIKRSLFLHKNSEKFFRSLYPQLHELNINEHDLIRIPLNDNSSLASVTDIAEIISFISPVASLSEAEWQNIAESVPAGYETIILTLRPYSRSLQFLQGSRRQTKAISFYEPVAAPPNNKPAPRSQNKSRPQQSPVIPLQNNAPKSSPSPGASITDNIDNLLMGGSHDR